MVDVVHQAQLSREGDTQTETELQTTRKWQRKWGAPAERHGPRVDPHGDVTAGSLLAQPEGQATH